MWSHFCFPLSGPLSFFHHSDASSVLSTLSSKPNQDILDILLATIARRLTPQPIKLRADIELTCYTPAGIDAIQRALRKGEAQGSDGVPIKAKLVAPPLYVLSTNATDKVNLSDPDVFRCLRAWLAHSFLFTSMPLSTALNVQLTLYNTQSNRKGEHCS